MKERASIKSNIQNNLVLGIWAYPNMMRFFLKIIEVKNQ